MSQRRFLRNHFLQHGLHALGRQKLAKVTQIIMGPCVCLFSYKCLEWEMELPSESELIQLLAWPSPSHVTSDDSLMLYELQPSHL